MEIGTIQRVAKRSEATRSAVHWIPKPARRIYHLLVIALVALLAGSPRTVEASPSIQLELALTTSEVAHSEASSLFRAVVQNAIDRFDRSRIHRSAIISATLVRFENASGVSECVIAAMVRTKDGRLLASLQGKASALKGTRASLVLGEAVDGVLANLPRALR